jgi:hypothetical protein
MYIEKYLNHYKIADPIVKNYEEYFIIYQTYDKDRVVDYTILYHPKKDEYMYVDTLKDIYLTCTFNKVKYWMSSESIDKFIFVSGSQSETKMNSFFKLIIGFVKKLKGVSM